MNDFGRLEDSRTFALFHELDRERLSDAAASALVVLAVGAIEQHGPHLPAGTDTYHAEWVASRAARAAGQHIPVLLTPTLPFGSSAHHMPFGATLSLKTTTFYSVLYDIGESVAKAGFRRMFFVNGHGGNHELCELVARDLSLAHRISVGAASWWKLALDEFGARDRHERGRIPGHAGAFETSVMLAIKPDAVSRPLPQRDQGDQSVARDNRRSWRLERAGFWQSIDGWTDSPDLASREQGAHYLETAVRVLADTLVEFYHDSG